MATRFKITNLKVPQEVVFTTNQIYMIMKNPLLEKPILLNVVVLVISGFISWFTLLMGFAHVFEGIKQFAEGNGPDIPIGQSILGWIIVLTLCIIGILTLVISIAAIKGIINKIKNN